MAKGIYIGVDGKARKGKKAYVGVAQQIIQGDIIPKTWTEVTTGTSYIAEDGTKLTASGYGGASYPCVKACDGTIVEKNITASWCSEELTTVVDGSLSNGSYTYEGWIQLEFPIAKKITKFKIHTYSTATTPYVRFFGSNDNANWTIVSNNINGNNQALTEYSLTQPDYYKYYRARVTCREYRGVVYIDGWQVSEYEVPASEAKGVARKVIKGYIGVGGVARTFFSSEQKLEYYGALPVENGITTKRDNGAITSIGDYALFARGASGQADLQTISSKLVRGTATNLSQARSHLEGESVGDYALFAGGDASNVTYATVDTYTSNLAKGTASDLSLARSYLRSASVGNYALFSGGRDSGSNTVATVDAYSSTLVKSTPSALTTARYRHTGASIGNYALFAGGTKVTTVETYTSALVKGTAAAMTKGGEGVSATSIGDYALIGNGYYNGSSTTVDAYSSTLVKTTTSMASYRYSAGAATIGDFALFAGGYSNSYTATVDVFKPDLTRETTHDLSVARTELLGASVGDYAIFAGGSTTSTRSEVDIYQVV